MRQLLLHRVLLLLLLHRVLLHAATHLQALVNRLSSFAAVGGGAKHREQCSATATPLHGQHQQRSC
jgi:hypothetical protein